MLSKRPHLSPLFEEIIKPNYDSNHFPFLLVLDYRKYIVYLYYILLYIIIYIIIYLLYILFIYGLYCIFKLLLLGFILAWLPVKQYYSEWITMDKKVKMK